MAEFEFTSYKFEPQNKKAVFCYKITIIGKEPILFSETIIFPEAPNLKGVPAELLEKILQSAHLALGISYYKLHCAKKIKTSYKLSGKEADFWNSFYKKGLGEFLYKNGLDPKIIPAFKTDNNCQPKNYRVGRNHKFLVGVAGGKDSIVSLELFKKYGADLTAVFIETQRASPLVDNILQKSQINSLKIRRILDEKIFNESAGYYNGHVPVSGIYAFLGLLAEIFYGYSFFAVSNEFSSNFGNTRYKKITVNHQWSKSYEFEKIFQDYVRNFISPDVFYFSLLRPFYEIRIAELFSAYQEYFYDFSSCNSNFKIKTCQPDGKPLWCGRCAKCLFVFLILSPFLSKETLISIFGRNFFEDAELLVLIRDILGFGKIKPLDCVGTFEEAKAAFYMSREMFKNDLAGEIFLPKIDPEDSRYFFDEKKRLLKIYFDGKKNPQELIDKVFKAQESSVPDYLKFLGMKNALIVGYGIEGQAAEKYLKKNFQDLKIETADEKNDVNYLSRQKYSDIAVKSPGIPKNFIKIPYTTPTNIFFSYAQNIPGVKIVGVTGTKGKSTTSSLICHILRTAGRNAILLGNIGTPMLDALLSGQARPGAIFVLELSSYQLDDIRYSPDISVVTSLFPEHMDHHMSLKNYYGAKKNIIKYHNKEDVFIFDFKNKKILKWQKYSNAKPVDFEKESFLEGIKIPLLGEHNRQNIRAAVSAVKQFGLLDKEIKMAIETFKPLPHRLEFVGEFKNIRFYDDAISTTPESTILAIKALKDVDTIFLGGEDRGYNFKQLERIIKKQKIRNVVLFPDSGEKINVQNLNVLRTKNMEEAVDFAYKHTAPGKICLLSCASPSYSVWKNFEEKGNQFKSYVEIKSKL